MADTAAVGGWRPQLGFGERLRLVRLEFGRRRGRRLSQREMALLVDVSEASYAQWEAGNARPADIVATVKRISAITEADPIWLLDLDGSRGPFKPPGAPIPVAPLDSEEERRRSDQPDRRKGCSVPSAAQAA